MEIIRALVCEASILLAMLLVVGVIMTVVLSAIVHVKNFSDMAGDGYDWFLFACYTIAVGTISALVTWAWH